MRILTLIDSYRKNCRPSSKTRSKIELSHFLNFIFAKTRRDGTKIMIYDWFPVNFVLKPYFYKSILIFNLEITRFIFASVRVLNHFETWLLKFLICQ